jgi:L-cystine transport system ATP-binding protein
MSDAVSQVPAVQVRNVCKSFGKNRVLKGISFTVKKGEVVVILGPSGSGKTTLLRCINLLGKADDGELFIGDQRVNFRNVSKKEIMEIRRKTAFVFQNFNLFKHKNAIENVMEGLVTARNIPSGQAAAMSREALDKVGLADKYDAYPSQLSGGQQQRVAIARAIVLNPEVILFDEPTSALDPELIGETLQVIRNVAGEGSTMIIVTHEMSFAREVANHVIFMDGGVIVEEGPPGEMFASPKEERTRQFLKRIQGEFSYAI